MKKYNIILADPPWDYGNTKVKDTTAHGIVEKHYPSMKFRDIKELPIDNIADKDCYLLLWVTSPFLEKGFELIKSWGFKYATVGFVWIKMKNDKSEPRADGLGHYTNSNAEYCLIARKGKYWRNSRKVRQVVLEPKDVHSKKPIEVHKRIVELCGDLPRIELFAREKQIGWDIWGNELNNDVDLFTLGKMSDKNSRENSK